MTDATSARLRPLADTSPSAVVAGFIAMLTGYTSSLVLMFQAGQAAGLTNAQISSWIWALSIGMAVCSIGLSLRYRTPITVAWSTPGAALLITSLGGVSYGEAIGAYITCALLVVICGLTGSFERLVKRIPASLASALLAGILFKIGSEIFVAAQHRTLLVLGMFFSYLLVKRLSPRYCVLAALLVGTALSGALGLLDFSGFKLEVATPVWTTPSFSLAATISIGIPLFVVAMTSQNMPGVAVLRADGYQVPASPLISTTGLASLLLAPFGSHGVNLAAISAAICTGPHAHEDPGKRYTAAVWCGIFYGIAGTFGLNGCPAGTAGTGHVDHGNACIAEQARHPGGNACTDFLDDHRRWQLAGQGFDALQHSTPVTVALWLYGFLQGVQVNDQGIGLQGVDGAACQVQAVGLTQLGSAEVGQ